MTHYVTGPDGRVHQFADTDPEEVINQRMSQLYPQVQGGALRAGPKPPALQQPGESTVAAGRVTPNLQQIPNRFGDEDWATLAMSMLFPKAAEVLGRSPGKVYQTEQAKHAADTLAKTEAAQRAGLQSLAQYARLKYKAQQMPEDIYKQVTGQYATKPFKDYLPMVGGMTAPAAKAAYLPNVFGGKAAEDVAGYQTELEHLVHGVNAAAGQAATTDAQRDTVNHAMADFMKAGNRQKGLDILEDAGLLLANNANIPPDVAHRIVNMHMQRFAAEDEHKNLVRAAAGVKPEAVEELLANARAHGGAADPRYVASFDKYAQHPGLAQYLIEANGIRPQGGTAASTNVQMPNPESVPLPKTPNVPVQGLE